MEEGQMTDTSTILRPVKPAACFCGHENHDRQDCQAWSCPCQVYRPTDALEVALRSIRTVAR